MHGSRSRQGVTLLELMIALAVMAVSIFAILTMIMYTISAKESQRELALAKEAVQKKLDELKGQPWATLTQVVPPGTAYDPFTVEGLSHPATADKRGKGTVTILSTRLDPVNPLRISLIDVEVRVDWKGVYGGNSTYAMGTLLTQ